MIKKVLLFVSVLLLVGCAPKNYKLLQENMDSAGNVVENSSGTSSYSSYTASNLPARIDYRILKHDRLAINIYQHPELIPPALIENGILVDSSGYVSLPLIHRVRVAGLTQTQAAKMLERRYAKYLRNPALNLEVLNKRVYVLGEVKKPGPIKVDKEYMTILEAVSSAGGLTDSAVRDNIIIVSRDANGNMNLRRVDLTNFDKLRASNITIKPNDVIYVQPNSAKEFKIASDNITEPLRAITDILTPFATVRTLTK